MFACGEAVNAANLLQNLGQVHDLLKRKATLAWRDALKFGKGTGKCFTSACPVQTAARCRSCRSRASRKQALVKMLPPFSATLSPAFSRYLCSRSSRISTEFSTEYTASMVLWYYWEKREEEKLKFETAEAAKAGKPFYLLDFVSKHQSRHWTLDAQI